MSVRFCLAIDRDAKNGRGRETGVKELASLHSFLSYPETVTDKSEKLIG